MLFGGVRSLKTHHPDVYLPRSRDPCCAGNIPWDRWTSACSLLSANIANPVSPLAPGCAASTIWMAATEARPYPSYFNLLVILSPSPVHHPFFSLSSWAIFSSIILLGLLALPVALPHTKKTHQTTAIPRCIQTGPAQIHLPCRVSVGTHIHSRTWVTNQVPFLFIQW